MRNAIKYYYSINVDEITRNDNDYFFDKYILRNIYRKVDYDIYSFFLNNKIFTYKIVINNFNSFETVINSKKYILLDITGEKKFEINDLLSLYMINNHSMKIDWSTRWKRKVDYYEKNYERIEDKNFKSIFSYYIGLSENAIKYFDENVTNNCQMCFSHERINSSYEFFCPDNIILDCKARDISEFVKYSFYQDRFELNEFIYFLNKVALTTEEYIVLYSRLLFPTYFFDSIEFGKDFNKIFSKMNQYEKLLCKLYNFFSKKCDLPPVEWIIKKYSNKTIFLHQ